MPAPLDAIYEKGATSMKIGDSFRIDFGDDWTGTIDDLALLEHLPVHQILFHDYLFDDEHLARLSTLTLPRLKRIWLSDTFATDDGLRYLQSIRGLRGLVLSTGLFTDTGMRHISEMTQLTELNISEQAVTDDGLSFISRLPNLEQLCCQRTLIEGHTLSNFVSNEQLSELRLCGTFVGKAGVEATRRMHGLNLLSLDNTLVSDEDFHDFAHPGLERLSLGGTNVTNETLTSIANSPEISALWLWQTRVTDTGIGTLARRQQLHFLQLWNTTIARTETHDLLKSHPNCDIHFHKPDEAF